MGLTAVALLALFNWPAHCGFDSSPDCVNPSANDLRFYIEVSIFSVIAIPLFVWIQALVISLISGVVMRMRACVIFAVVLPLAFVFPGVIYTHYSPLSHGFKIAIAADLIAWGVAWTLILAFKSGLPPNETSEVKRQTSAV
jgi:hypothetical protein